METNDGGKPAFPFSALIPDQETRQMTGMIYKDNEGLTRREYFAAKAMQGILSNPTWNCTSLQFIGVSDAARMSVGYADALLAALKEG